MEGGKGGGREGVYEATSIKKGYGAIRALKKLRGARLLRKLLMFLRWANGKYVESHVIGNHVSGLCTKRFAE